MHDFGKAIPYGVYDIGANAGCVSVGIDHDTVPFAVNAIRRWRATMGGERYPAAGRLMITADGGGSNGSRVRLWKVELRKFADETGLSVGGRRVDRGATTKKGLTVRCQLDTNAYEKGVKVSDAEMAALNIEGDAFHPEWNYTIKPRRREAPR